MSKYIDVEQSNKILRASMNKAPQYSIPIWQMVIDLFEILPPADVEPVRHGHWIFEGCSVENYKELIYKCSVCDRWVSICENFEYELYDEYPYCHCGAKMDEEEKEC